jgi:phage terminase large subunit GpA-like protein
MKNFPKALPLIAGIFAAMLAPGEPVVPSAWGAKNLTVVDGPRAGGKWDPTLSPYVAPIVDILGPEGPENFVVVRKSSQTGLSEGAILLTGSYVDRAPCRIGYAVQTTEALAEFNKEKLAPTIAQSPALAKKVRPQTSRSANGSTERTKRFPGGSLSLINGNSAADLKSRTLKVGIADEVDSWPDDIGDDGDPLDLFKARFISFHASGDWRLLVLSTPQVLGTSRIDGLFKAGDQRFWHVPCPACDEKIVLNFKHLKFERKPPYAAHYVAQCCGHPIEHHEKSNLVRAGEFIATNPEGLYPSFHVDALISQVTTWDKIAETWWAAQGNEKKLRVFYNTWLGLPFEIRGDAPDHIRLFERRGGYEPGHIPAGGLLLTCGVDVQHSGIWVEVVAYGQDAQSWTIHHEFFEGDTTDPERGAFAKLAAFYEMKFPDAYGRLCAIDAIAVDAGDGGRFNQVLAWCRGRPRTFAIKGRPGWQVPAVGTPTTVDITLAGRKIARGAAVWPVGTWSLKATWYADLRKIGGLEGQEAFPAGYCHFHSQTDERYFRQMTSEYLGTATIKGRTSRVWKETGPNHLLDCRIYARAMAEYLGLSRMTPEEWAIIVRDRGAPEPEPDLFAPDPLKAQSARVAAAPADNAESPIGAPGRGGWIAPKPDWMGKN